MRHTIRIFMLSAFIAVTCSCNKFDLAGLFFSSSPDVDERFEVSSEYNESRGPVSIEASRDDYRVYLCTDVHIEGDLSKAQAFVDACLADDGAEEFSICLGDLVSGSGNEPLARKTLEPLDSTPRQLFCAVGNHDINFGQWEEYIANWHTASYTFEVHTPGGATDFYICLDSASGTLGSSQLSWLKALLSDTSGYRNVIVLTHTHFFKKDNSQGHAGNFNLDETYLLLDLFASSGVDCVLSGHRHYYDLTQFRGVDYYTLGALKYDNYYTATVSADGVRLEAVQVGK